MGKRRASEFKAPWVYERGSQFEVKIRRLHDGHYINHRTVYPYLAGDDASRRQAFNQANAYAAKKRAELDRARLADPGLHPMMDRTFGEWIDQFISEALNKVWMEKNQNRKPPATAKHSEYLLRNIEKVARSLWDTPVFALRAEHFGGSGGMLSKLKGLNDGPASPGTKRRYVAALNAVWSHAYTAWGIPDQVKPWAKVVVHGDGKEPPAKAMKPEEFDRVFAELRNTDLHTRACIQFMRWTACRKGEAVRLCWENIIWPTDKADLPKAHLKRTKSARGSYKERHIFLTDEAVAALRSVVPQSPPAQGKANKSKVAEWPTSGPVFHREGSPSEPLTLSVLTRAWTRARKRARLAYRLHDLRHTRITEYSVVLSQAQAMAQSGHTNPRTFQLYTHLATESGRLMQEADDAQQKLRALSATAKKRSGKSDSADALVAALAGMSKEQRELWLKVIQSSTK